jgi:hypothetical protein
MAPYVQLGPGWRPNYGLGRLRRRRTGGRQMAATIGIIAAVFAAGLLIGRIEGKSSAQTSAAPQPVQYYPR